MDASEQKENAEMESHTKSVYQAAPANAPTVATSATVDIDPPHEDPRYISKAPLLSTAQRTMTGSSAITSEAGAAEHHHSTLSGVAHIHKTSAGATLITPLSEVTASPPAAPHTYLLAPRMKNLGFESPEERLQNQLDARRRLAESRDSLKRDIENLNNGEDPEKAAQFYHDQMSARPADPLERFGLETRRGSRSFSFSRTSVQEMFDNEDPDENEWRIERKKICCFRWLVRD